MSSFTIDNNLYYGQYTPSVTFISQDTDLSSPFQGYLYIQNIKQDSALNLKLPTTSEFNGISLTIKNTNLYYNVLSTSANIKQIDNTVSNVICGADNFSNIVFDGTNWLIAMTN